MAVTLDFLTKEIFVKIITKTLGVFRTLFLLYFFTISNVLDNFYYAKSIVSVVLLINILFEITYSSQLNINKDNSNYLKKIHLVLNKFSIVIALGLILFLFISDINKKVFFHTILLSFWAILNINSNFFLLIFRYKNYTRKVLSYYLILAVFDVVLLLFLLEYVSSGSQYLAISLSLLISELLTVMMLFYNYGITIYRKGNMKLVTLSLEIQLLYKVFTILVLVSCIEISDKYFLSYLGDGNITYYTYGLYAPLVIRQSLDIRSNFFVQLNLIENKLRAKHIFIMTIKKLSPFFLSGILILLVSVQVLESVIMNIFKIDNFTLFRNIILIGVIITPLYMIWDLFYRFYYVQNKVDKLLVLVFMGLVLNIFFNYVLSLKFSWGIYGILISTLSVFLFYNIISYKYFFLDNNN